MYYIVFNKYTQTDHHHHHHHRVVCLHPRQTWSLSPPEVGLAALQYAGWGPVGQQLVRSPFKLKSNNYLFGSNNNTPAMNTDEFQTVDLRCVCRFGLYCI